MSRVGKIKEQLTQAFHPEVLNIIDESEAHAGHIGAQSGGGHFAIEIQADMFKDKKLLESHRLIYAALDNMMQTEIHALRIKIL